MTSTTPARALERRAPNAPAVAPTTPARTGGRHVALSPRAARRAARLEDASWTASAEEERRHVDLVSTKRPSAPRAKSSFAKRAKPFATFGVMTLATGLFVSVSLPAAAAGVDVDAATGGAIPSAATMQSVSYSVPSTAADVPFVRDGYGATSQEEVDAASAAAAAAAAEAAASASAASSSSASASAGRTYAAPAVARSGEAILAYAAQFVGVVPYGNGGVRCVPASRRRCAGRVGRADLGVGGRRRRPALLAGRSHRDLRRRGRHVRLSRLGTLRPAPSVDLGRPGLHPHPVDRPVVHNSCSTGPRSAARPGSGCRVFGVSPSGRSCAQAARG
jgi:hypothetical protein